MAQSLKEFGIKDFAKMMTQAPIFQARIISDENIWMLSPLQFHFQFIFGYELKTVVCSIQIAKESVVIQTDCGKDENKVEGTS